MRGSSNRIAAAAALLVFLIAANIHAQVNLAFVKYLSENKFSREHLSYIDNYGKAGGNSDSVNYLSAKYYLQYGNDSLFLTYYQRSISLFLKDTCINLIANKKIWIAGIDPEATDYKTIPEKLQMDFLCYKKYHERKPMVAAVLSTVVPGLGKLYAGRKHAFLPGLLMNAGYGLASYESISKLGIRNPFSIFSISIFSVFYATTIYGSYIDLIQVKKERQTQFEIDASTYYSTNCACELY